VYAVRRENLIAVASHTFSHFGVTQESAAPAVALLARRHDWRLARRIVTYRKVEWALYFFSPYKSPGVGGIFPALLQKAREVIIPHLIRIFLACLSKAFGPVIWQQFKVVVIPKPVGIPT